MPNPLTALQLDRTPQCKPVSRSAQQKMSLLQEKHALLKSAPSSLCLAVPLDSAKTQLSPLQHSLETTSLR